MAHRRVSFLGFLLAHFYDPEIDLTLLSSCYHRVPKIKKKSRRQENHFISKHIKTINRMAHARVSGQNYRRG